MKTEVELERIINRYSDESDLTASELIGTLEIIKQSCVSRLFHKEKEP